MKNLILFFALCISCTAFGQRSVNKFYRQQKQAEGARGIALPGLAFKIGSKIFKNRADGDDPVAQLSVDLIKKIKGVKVLTVEDYSPADRQEINEFVDSAKQKNGFEDMFMFKTAGTDIHFLMRDKGDIIQNLVILISSEEDGLMMMNMKSKLKKSEIAELINMAVKQAKGEDYEEEEQEEEKPAPKEKPVSKTPRA
ncbi:MAG: hypothetical protein ACI85O_002503 [Saprospiraceae bacterium]|jgi:hypothetical protein